MILFFYSTKNAYFEALLPHQNMTSVIGVCVDADRPAIVFEFIDGWRLEEMLQGIGCMIPYVEFVLQCAVQIVSALCVLHANGIVHRDVALRNVMITRELVCKLLDFGLSAYGDDTLKFSCRPNECIPMRWSPPETFINVQPQVTQDADRANSGSDAAPVGVAFSTKTDCWALGVLLWEMFSLSLPYGIFPTLAELKERIGDESRRLERPPQCPRHLYERVMVPLLVADPNERPSMQDIKEELCSLLAELEGGSDLGGFSNDAVPHDELLDAVLLEKIYLVL